MSTTAANGKAEPVTSEILDRQPPRDLDAEKGVLGSVLLKPEICEEVFPLVAPDDFYCEANQKIFGHLQSIHRSGAKPDLTLLVNRLNSSGDYENIGGTRIALPKFPAPFRTRETSNTMPGSSATWPANDSLFSTLAN